jgi:hypothetical protein
MVGPVNPGTWTISQRALSEIIYSPERLKVGVATSDQELLSVHQVEAGQWSNVVDVPLTGAATPVLPGHAWQEPGFEMSS